MKKFLAVLLSLVMAFSFCLPAFAEDTTASGGGNDFINQTIKKVSKH